MVQIKLSAQQARTITEAQEDIQLIDPEGHCVTTLPAPFFSLEEVAEGKRRSQSNSGGTPVREVLGRLLSKS